MHSRFCLVKGGVKLAGDNRLGKDRAVSPLRPSLCLNHLRSHQARSGPRG